MNGLHSDKRIVIEFYGGDFDGRKWDSFSPDPIESKNAIEFGLTFFREVGGGLSGMGLARLEASWRGERQLTLAELKPPRDGRFHAYTVTQRLEDESAILIRVEYGITDAGGNRIG